MRIMTLNMRYGSGSDRPGEPGYDLPTSAGKLAAIARAIASVDPEVVALQEVRNQAQAERLAALTSMNSVYLSHPVGYRLFFFEWGLAFLYRPKLVECAGRSLLIDHRSGAGRTGLVARFAAGGTVLTFINVHFDHGDKEAQLQHLLRLCGEWPSPLCLLGDFNCDPEDPLLSPLTPRLADTCRLAATPLAQEALATGTMLESGGRRDHIWVEPQHFAVVEAGLVAPAHRRVSDHLCYWAEIALSYP